MLQFDLTAQLRNKFGKGGARALRREGMTPAILYGAKKTEPVALQLNTKIFTKTLLKVQRRNAVLNLLVDDSNIMHHVMVKELQTNPTNDSLVHADLYEVLLDTPMVLEVPVHYTGTAKGVDLGGDLHVHLAKISLRGLALDIPDFIEIDVTNLRIGDRLNLGDLNIPANVELLDNKETTCVSITHAAKGQLGAEGEEAVEADVAADEGADEEGAD